MDAELAVGGGSAPHVIGMRPLAVMQRLLVLQRLHQVLALAFAEGLLAAERESLASLPNPRCVRRFRGGGVARFVKIGRGFVMHLKTPRPRTTLTPTARPREQRPRRRMKTAARGDPDEPPLAEIPPAEFRRQLDALGVGR